MHWIHWIHTFTDHEGSAALAFLSVWSSGLYNRREEGNLLPGCFHCDLAAFGEAATFFTAESGEEWPRHEGGKDGWESNLYRSSIPDWCGLCSCVWMGPFCHPGAPRAAWAQHGSPVVVCFSMVCVSLRVRCAMYLDPMWPVGWWLGHSPKTNSHYSLNNKLILRLALITLLIIKHLAVIFKYLMTYMNLF